MTPARSTLIAAFSLALSGLLSAHAATPRAGKAAEPKSAVVNEEVRESVDLSNIQLFVSAGDYDRLQAYIDKAIKERPTAPTGSSTRAILYNQLATTLSDFSSRAAGCLSHRDSMLEAWKRARPHSTTVWIAAIEHELDRAFCWRGGGYTDTVSLDNERRFSNIVSTAKKELDEHAEAARTDPEWFVEAILIATYQSWSAKDALSLIMSGSDRFPTYFRIYNRGMVFFSARWNGSDQVMESYAEAMSKRAQAKMGDEAYARMYHYINAAAKDVDYRADSPIDWAHMVRSMRAIANHYPDRSNFSSFARISCDSGDIAAFHEFANHMGNLSLEREVRAAASRDQCERVISRLPSL